MKPCGCEEVSETYVVLCTFHWNLMQIRNNLDDCRVWEASGRLNPDEPSDKRVLDFYDQLVYWAAKGVGDKGLVR